MILNQDFQYVTLGHDGPIYKGAKIVDFFISDFNNKDKWHKFKSLQKGTLFLILEFNNYINYILFESVYPDGGGASVSLNLSITDFDGSEFKTHEKFERVNKGISELPFNVYVHGGETGGYGKNEHGDAHFELKELNTNKLITKIYMSTLDVWNKSNFKERIKLLNSFNGRNLNKKERVKFVVWLSKNANANLIKCHNFWNDGNKNNNRTNPIN